MCDENFAISSQQYRGDPYCILQHNNTVEDNTVREQRVVTYSESNSLISPQSISEANIMNITSESVTKKKNRKKKKKSQNIENQSNPIVSTNSPVTDTVDKNLPLKEDISPSKSPTEISSNDKRDSFSKDGLSAIAIQLDNDETSMTTSKRKKKKKKKKSQNIENQSNSIASSNHPATVEVIDTVDKSIPLKEEISPSKSTILTSSNDQTSMTTSKKKKKKSQNIENQSNSITTSNSPATDTVDKSIPLEEDMSPSKSPSIEISSNNKSDSFSTESVSVIPIQLKNDEISMTTSKKKKKKKKKNKNKATIENQSNSIAATVEVIDTVDKNLLMEGERISEKKSAKNSEDASKSDSKMSVSNCSLNNPDVNFPSDQPNYDVEDKASDELSSYSDKNERIMSKEKKSTNHNLLEVTEVTKPNTKTKSKKTKKKIDKNLETIVPHANQCQTSTIVAPQMENKAAVNTTKNTTNVNNQVPNYNTDNRADGVAETIHNTEEEQSNVRNKDDVSDTDATSHHTAVSKTDSRSKTRKLFDKATLPVKEKLCKLIGKNKKKQPHECKPLQLQSQCSSAAGEISVTFQVLIEKSVCQDNNVCIIFGKPLGDWKSAHLLEKSPVEIKAYKTMIRVFGTLPFDRKYCGQKIPYKYVVLDGKSNNEVWEKFFEEDSYGNDKNRFVEIPKDCTEYFDKYDDCITLKPNCLDTHSTGRKSALVVFSIDSFDFENTEDEKIVERLQFIFSTQCQQKLIDKRERVEPFGRYFNPDGALKKLVDHCDQYLGKSEVQSYHMAIILSLFLSRSPMKIKKNFALAIGRVFFTFKFMVKEFNSTNESFLKLHMSDTLRMKVGQAVGILMNHYIDIITTYHEIEAHPCVYAYAFVKLLQVSEDNPNQTNFNYFKANRLSSIQGNSMRKVLKDIEQISAENNPSFQSEFLELCPDKLFMDILTPQYLKCFIPTSLFIKFCELCSKTVALIPDNRSKLVDLKTIFLEAIPCLEKQQFSLWNEAIGKCLSTNLYHDHDIVLFYFEILHKMKVSIDDRNLYSECADIVHFLESITNKAIQISKRANNQKQQAAKMWSQYFTVLENLDNKLPLRNLQSAFKNEVSTWSSDECQRVLIKNFGELNEVVVNILLDVIIYGDLNSSKEKSLWNTFFDKVNFEKLKAAKKVKGLLLSRLILSFPLDEEKNEEFAVKTFLLVTESDTMVKILETMEIFKNEPLLMDKANDHLNLILSNLDYFIALLQLGDIKFLTLQHLATEMRKNRLIKIYDLCGISERRSIIELRLEQYNFTNKTINSIRQFSQYMLGCKEFSLENILKFDENNSTLKQFCEILDDNNLSESFKFIGSSLTDENIHLIATFDRYKSCHCFLQILSEERQDGLVRIQTIDEAFSFIQKTIDKFEIFCHELCSGTLLISDVIRYFHTQHKDDSKFQNELNLIGTFINSNSNSKWTDEVHRKIQLAFSMQYLTKMTASILEVMRILNIQDCDTSPLDNIHKFSCEDWSEGQLNHLTDDLQLYNVMFSSWNDDTLLALETFNKCEMLINWVRKNIANAGELKVFIDLAHIYAGESDIEVGQVRCFQQAVMAYSGLIFDCRESCTLEKLFSACQSLSNTIERDKHITDKLLDTNCHVNWLESIKNRHGSVETSSLNLIKLISLNGEIKMKLVASSCSSFVTDISMNFEEEHDQEIYQRNLNLNALKELESKLMLISANGWIKSEIDRFTSVLHLVILIGNNLDQLLIAGCCLFSQLTITAYFSVDMEVTVKIDFGHKTGLILGSNNLSKELSSILSFLCRSLSEWHDYIMRVREQYPILNHYTTDQLMILSRFMADVQFQRKVNSQEPLMLLSLIANDSDTEEELLAALKEFSMNESVNNSDDFASGNSLDSTIPFDWSMVRKMIDHMSSNYDFEEEHTLAAILQTGNASDVDELVSWCLLHEEERATFNELDKYFFRDQAAESDTTNCETALNNYDEKMSTASNTKLSEKLFELWSNFLNSSNVNNAEDYITFKQLCHILQLLNDKLSTPINRTFPTFLESGKPNLIVAEKSVIHSTALSFYQLDENKRFPTLDELLICDHDTSLEQLVLHCLRAFHDTTGKIYTFLNAERINFHNCCHLEKLFLKPVANHEYRLIFISSKEEKIELNSFIANALQRNRVQIPNVLEIETLRAYLHQHLVSASIDCTVDPDELSFRLFSSQRSGEGKSLCIKRICKKNDRFSITIPVHTEKIDNFNIVDALFKRSVNESGGSIIHIDLFSNVREGVQDFLFSTSVMGGLRDSKGRFWKCGVGDYYAIEMVKNLPDLQETTLFQNLLPTVWCQSPKLSLQFYEENHVVITDNSFYLTSDGLCKFMDYPIFIANESQLPFQYLEMYYNNKPLDTFTFSEKKHKNPISFLDVLLKACCVEDPTWMELINFLKFLNIQLINCEKSIYCSFDFVGNTLPGFKTFVVKFLIQMAKDFATRSAVISDDSFCVPEIPERNRWENNFHPYLFFNEDGDSFCFFGFKIKNGHLIDDRNPGQEKIIMRDVMDRRLQKGLSANGIDFNRDLHRKSQQELRKIYLKDLRKVFGLNKIVDEDMGYELTSDNVLKMLAIQMRFHADIPVMIMGETGTGKTRLIRFICDLQRQGRQGNNLIILKCHGGIDCDYIYGTVKKAVELAKTNTQNGIRQTVLFFDEANTTNAIGAIKEVMCDKRVNGEPIEEGIGLKFVAAVNPYRQHSQEMILKLENAGLGYHMKAENTADKFGGEIPMRRLVYRVRELPQSILPLIWDFGKLDDITEEKYIIQMVEKRIKTEKWPVNYKAALVTVLIRCQSFMRGRKDECSFVSLRDVDRCLEIFTWFNDKSSMLIQPILFQINTSSKDFSDYFIIQIILSVGCCYYVRLDDRREFCRKLSGVFMQCGYQMVNETLFKEIINSCQDLFIKQLNLESTISRNEALKENFWIMAICIELKIPVFLVGKPGCSKSLAKTKLSGVMLGEASYSPLFKQFKEIQLVSFQCSPIATAEGILSIFRQCQKHQKGQNLESFASVVVLDEIGLAEDSPLMPLKTLHPLLEDGCLGDELPESDKKVGFVGISNWALDPAKMNRGIFVCRGNLSREDLLQTARDIFKNHEGLKYHLEIHLNDIVDCFLHILDVQEREYYGLRDFYSLIKMLYQACKANDEQICVVDLKRAICRCFGGYFGELKPAEIFLSRMSSIPIEMRSQRDVNNFEIICGALKETEENRYLLLLTKSNAALRILLENENLFKEKVNLIFGSSFPQDQEYMALCKNINRIKLAMETGQTVILCNLTNLYESLYDALNQSYVYYGGFRYVDLGLGMHRVKCRVDSSFRLVVVSEDTDVIERFPIPLINRFEKHYLTMESLIVNDGLEDLKHDIEQWIVRFSELKLVQNESGDFTQYTPEDVFIGYHTDVPASLIYQSNKKDDNLFQSIKKKLISCACPDSIARLNSSLLSPAEIEEATQIYHIEQQHTSLASTVNSMTTMNQIFLEVTTHSRLLTISSKNNLASEVGLPENNLKLISLHEVETESEFKCQLVDFFDDCSDKRMENILVIQCLFHNPMQQRNLIECVQYCVRDTSDNYPAKMFAIVLLIQIERVKGGKFIGFSPNPWCCVHLDEINSECLPLDIYQMKGKCTTQIFQLLNDETFCALLLEASPNSCSQTFDEQRIVQRINILNHLLKTSHLSKRFLISVRKQVINIQKKLESTGEYTWQDLLAQISMESIYLREGHTFQKSLWLTLVDKITPIFGRIIQFCDFQHGLNHLKSNCEWLQTFYLDILDSLDIASLAVLNSPENDVVSCLPFSWVMIDYFDATYFKYNAFISDFRFHFALQNETELGASMKALINRNKEETSKLFANDLILYKFPVLKSTENFLKVCLNCVLSIAGNEKNRLQHKANPNIETFDEELEDETLENLIDIYLAFQSMSNVIQMLCDSLTFYEKCFSKPLVMNRISVEDIHSLMQSVLTTILDDLEPPNVLLTNSSIRKRWLKHLNHLRILLQKYLTFTSEPGHQLIGKYRRLEILSLYVDLIISKYENVTFRQKTLFSFNQLKSALKLSTDMKSSQSFQRILNILSSMLATTWKQIFSSGAEKCFICLKEIDKPVALPCKHVACFNCLEVIASDRVSCSIDGKWNCPFEECKAIYSEEFSMKSTLECETAIEEYRMFQESITVFFLELLQRFTFSDGSPPDFGVIKCLLEFVFPKKVQSIEPIKRKFTLFDSECIGSKPLIRSFLFRQILRGNWIEIDDYCETFNETFTDLFENCSELTLEFYLTLLFSIEDSMFNNTPLENSFLQFDRRENGNEMSIFLQDLFDNITANITNDLSIFQQLQLAAQLRISLSYTSQLIHCKIVQTDSKLSDMELLQLQCVQDIMLMMKEECLYKYLLKELAEKYSRESILEWKKRAVFLDMMHPSIRYVDVDYQPDYFCALGEMYLETKRRIYEQLTNWECKDDEFISADNPSQLVYIRLATFYFRNYLNLSQQSENYLIQLENRSEISLTGVPTISNIFLKLKSDISLVDKTIYSLMFHFHETLLAHNSQSSGLIRFFYVLCCNSNELIGTYFPTMPHDIKADIFELMKWQEKGQANDLNYFKKIYKCSCGRFEYGVGDCGGFEVSSRCPECGSEIGKKGCNSVEVKEFQDTTQTGHVLGAPESEDIVINVRQLTTTHVHVIRFLMQAAMLLSSDKDTISSLIVPPVSIDKLDEFLMAHLKKNFIQLSKCLGKSEDLTRIYLHLIMDHFQNYNSTETFDMSSKKDCLNWESKFIDFFPDIRDHLDIPFEIIQNEYKNESEDEDSGFLNIIEHEADSNFQGDESPFEVEQLWRPRVRISFTNIHLNIESNDMNQKCPLLTLLNENQDELTLLQHLTPILKLQSELITRFNRRLDISELENKSIYDFIFTHIEDSTERERVMSSVKIYLQVFNHLRYKLSKFNTTIGLKASEHYKSINPAYPPASIEDTPCGILFPNEHGFGLCALAVVELLIESHNFVLRSSPLRPEVDDDLVSPCIVDKSQLVAFDIHELEMLLLLNSEYSLQSGGATDCLIDLESMERHVINRFFVGRLILDTKLVPQLKIFNDDQSSNTTSLKISQEPIPSDVQSLIESSITCLPDLCQFISHCQTIRNLLCITVTSSEDPKFNSNSTIKSFANEIHLSIHSSILQCKILDTALLGHIDDLIVFLKVSRAKRMILLNQNPWQGLLPKAMQIEIDNELKERLNHVLHHIVPSILLPTFYCFIEECIISGKIANPDYKLSDCIYVFLFEKDDDRNIDIFNEYLPADALVKHCSNCFDYFVNKYF